MHEMGTVLYVVRIVEKIVEENQLSEVQSVTLEIGEVSGIIPGYIKKCWGFAAGRSKYLKDALLHVETLPARTVCRDCGCQYETVKHAKICPACGSDDTYLLCGNEYNVKEIEAR